jgi:hypothetical protein
MTKKTGQTRSLKKPKKAKAPIRSFPKVFLDANIVIAGGRPPGGPEIRRVADLVEAGLITTLTTDLTVTEVAKKHARNDFEAVKELFRPHFRGLAQRLTGVAMPEVRRTDVRERLKKEYDASTTSMFAELGARRLTIDDVRPSVVFDAYARREGFFADDAKKDQFPDAFAFECIRAEATEKTPVIIVSNDGDFVGPARDTEHISLVSSLPELFTKLGLEIKAPELDAFFAEHRENLDRLVDEQLNSWGLHSDDVMDAEIDEITVTRARLVRTAAFRPIEVGGSILVVGTVEVEATISFTHPNWDEAMYDSDDKSLIPFGDESGEAEVDLEIAVAMSISVDDDGDPEQIEALRFRNGRFQYVTLYPPDMDK